MDVETTLPGEVESGELAGEPGSVTDGLSAAILAEQESATGDAGSASGAGRRGRPPIHGLYSKAAGSDGKNPARPQLATEPLPGGDTLQETAMVTGPVGPSPRVTIPPDLLSKVIAESLTLAETGIGAALEGQGKLAGLSTEEIAPQLKRAQLGDGRKQVLADLAPYVAMEWGVDVEVSPTIAALLIVVPWAGGAAMAYFTLAGLAKEKAAREKAKERK